MKTKTPSLFSNAAIWFGAGVSIAEIITGTLIAPLGFAKGLFAILSGHLIGCLLLFMAGVIGQNTHKSSMETTSLSFGTKGAAFFATLNVIQLIGWTSIMIFNGANALSVVSGITNTAMWSSVLGILILIWIILRAKPLNILNTFSMVLLFSLTLILCKIIISSPATHTVPSSTITMGEAIELSITMPLSWLPLIADYTRKSKKGIAASAISASTYMLTSSWMYIIGMAAAILTGESDISIILSKAGAGTIAILIIIFSTITTTYLDVYSAGVSTTSITKLINEKTAAIMVSVIGTSIAVISNATVLENFLYFIGSVFTPMITIQLTDYFILKKNNCLEGTYLPNCILWVIGFVIYRSFMHIPIAVGYTIPSIIILSVICIITDKLKKV